jgi:hypothetical protein
VRLSPPSTFALPAALLLTISVAVACATETSAGGDDDASAGAGISASGAAPGTDGAGTDGEGASSGDSPADASAGPPAESTGPDGLKFDLGGQDTGEIGCDGDGDGDATPTFSFIWIANTNEGTVSKINTQTGIEEGRYRTSASGSDSPSRTSVNQFGDVLVANRNGGGAATKIAAIVERCAEKNGLPGIQTSTGAADVLPYLEDECVLWSTPMPINDHGPRGIAWEGGEIDPNTCMNTVPDPRVWVSFGGNPEDIYRLDGTTGAVLDHVSHPAGGGRIYGGAVNAEGDLWYVNRGTNRLATVDAVTLVRQEWAIPGTPYGMGVDANGDPWVVTYAGGAGVDHVYRFDVASSMFVDAGGTGGYYRGMNIDRDGKVWVGGNSPCRLAVFDGATDSLIDDAIPLPGCTTPVGVSIDFEGFVWVVDQNGTAYKVHPGDHSIVLMATGLVGPYTYSDMTGAGLDLVLNPPG